MGGEAGLAFAGLRGATFVTPFDLGFDLDLDLAGFFIPTFLLLFDHDCRSEQLERERLVDRLDRPRLGPCRWVGTYEREVRECADLSQIACPRTGDGEAHGDLVQIRADRFTGQARVDDLQTGHDLRERDLWRKAAAHDGLEFERVDQSWRSLRLVL